MSDGHSDPRDRPITQAELKSSLRVAGEAVLVGGQALAFWLAHYGMPVPPGPRLYISADADYLGVRDDLKRFAQALQARVEYPSRHDLSILHGAVVRDTRQGPKVLVDVMRKLAGLDEGAVRRDAIKVRWHEDAGEIEFRVMNPVDCLVSRLENLRKLEQKRTPVGVWQAGIGVEVCRAYLSKLIERNNEDAAIRGSTRVLKLAGSAGGLQAYRNHGLDALAAIPVDEFASMDFRTGQFARMAKRIEILRAAYRRPPPSRAARPS